MTGIETAIVLFMLRFIYVSASAFQQKSVINDNWLTIPVTCFIRAFCDYGSWGVVAFSVTSVNTVTDMVLSVLSMACGATLGVYAGMIAHNRLFRKVEQ